jgi:diguanylate cyclase (GGDEF)-like protein
VAIERFNLFESVREVGYTDALTGLANRRFFDFMLSREIGRARRYGRALSLMMLDIDYFKKINDTYGHPAGDTILKTMGELLRNLFRKTDLATRYGGEEFIIILPETSLDVVAQMAERFRDAVSRTRFATDNGYVSLTVSIGLASLPGQDAEGAVPETDLIQAADQALYRAKTKGRNRVEIA